jgi:hypothetical protein
MKKCRNKLGYILVYHQGKQVLEHRMIIQAAIGRKLSKDEDVHHINEIRDDNRIENLQIMSKSDHTRHHNKFKQRKKQTPRPEATTQGLEWICIISGYRKHIVGKCIECKKLFWHRKDNPTRLCNPTCQEKYTGNGKNLKKKYGHLGPKARCNKI